jgi:hypothetical protein
MRNPVFVEMANLPFGHALADARIYHRKERMLGSSSRCPITSNGAEISLSIWQDPGKN